MNGFEGGEGVVMSELDVQGGEGLMTKGSSSRHRLNSIKSSTAEESVPWNKCPLANTEQLGLILKGQSVFACSSKSDVQ